MLVLCSDHEGFPNVIAEAMAASLPVIATPAGDSGRIVVDGVTGYVIPFDDIEVLAAHIVELAKSPERAQAMGEAGRQRAEKEYSFTQLQGWLFSIYADIARKMGKPDVLAALEHTMAQIELEVNKQ